jgi:hypothetical protein
MITGSPPSDGQTRFVVENGYADTQTVTVTIDTHGSGPVINETRQLTPDEQWVVTTLNESTLQNGYTMTASAERDAVSHETSTSASVKGATLIVVGESLVTCEGNLSCYNKTA